MVLRQNNLLREALKMNFIKQAFGLESDKKEAAKRIYGEATKDLVRKDYSPGIHMGKFDAHTELSAIFGGMWFEERMIKEGVTFSEELMAEANLAFNYANFNLGISGRFADYAKGLVKQAERINDKQLNAYTKEMNCMLTCTTAENIIRANNGYMFKQAA
jgi:hypothetical protein